MPGQEQSFDEIARREDEKVAKGLEAEGYVRSTGTAEGANHVLLLHFAPEEIALIRENARAMGIDASRYVREAVMASLRNTAGERPAVVQELQRKLRELADTVERL